MPLNTTDRRILVSAAVVLTLTLLLSSLVAGPARDADPGFPSSRSPASAGAAAAYSLLAESGFEVERWRRPLSQLPSGSHAALVLAEPVMAGVATHDDQLGLLRFLSQGGSVVATGMAAGSFFPSHALDQMPTLAFSWTDYHAAAPGCLTAAAPVIRLLPEFEWPADRLAVRPVYVDGANHAAVIAWNEGAGRVVWWSSPTPLTNAGIREAGNLELLLNSIGSARDVYWDEYFHGEREAGSAEARFGWHYFAFPVALFVLALLWTFSRRFNPAASADFAAARESPLEFALYAGAMYERARTPQLALSLLRPSLARLAATGAHADAAPLLAEIDAAIQDPNLRESQALALARLLLAAAPPSGAVSL